MLVSAQQRLVIVCRPVVPPMRDNPAGDTTDQSRGSKGEQVADYRASHDAGSDHYRLVSDLISLW
jgi:hypothetical protein